MDGETPQLPEATLFRGSRDRLGVQEAGPAEFLRTIVQHPLEKRGEELQATFSKIDGGACGWKGFVDIHLTLHFPKPSLHARGKRDSTPCLSVASCAWCTVLLPTDASVFRSASADVHSHSVCSNSENQNQHMSHKGRSPPSVHSPRSADSNTHRSARPLGQMALYLNTANTHLLYTLSPDFNYL